MKLLSKESIDEFPSAGPDHEDSNTGYVKSLVKEGPIAFVSNAHVSGLALQIDGHLVPIIVSDGDPSDSSVCSIQAHYVESPARQLPSFENHLYTAAAKPFLALLRNVIRVGRLGRVVYLNDWLMTTNPPLQLSASQVAEVTRCLTAEYPDRAIVVRSTNPLTRSETQSALAKSGYDLIRSRRIYVFDSNRPDFKMKENLRKDLRLLKNWPGTTMSGALDEQGIQRVLELYRSLYLRKYSSGNPEFTSKFFQSVIDQGLFQFRYLVQNGELLAFTAWKEGKDEMLGTLLGYDMGMSQGAGLYRMAFALDFKEALERKVPYHLSSGAGQFKRLRGALPSTEYDAVFSRHLSAGKRILWKFFRALMRLAEKSEGESIDFKRAPRYRVQISGPNSDQTV